MTYDDAADVQVKRFARPEEFHRDETQEGCET